ncbi:mitochondrial ribosomal small subunit component [Pyrrhoderma noxium]|uniref:Mitochondrial ribosomal small subunit component n=1 Tax=Pyrrhoderma noxium TaxID=2282107 RepID=A0A286US45_9AGAM|nr:mitochondrial ribosomal small subunit component [Pyrrhoderma noxium]
MNSLLNAARTSASSSAPASRSFHTSLRAQFPRRKVGIPAPPILAKTGVFLDEDPDINERIPYEEREGQGSSSAGHLLLQQQRHMLKYMRLIEHDMPKLVRFREDFTPPSKDRPLVVRTIDYNGEEHPATAKRTVVVAVSDLPLKGAQERHTFKLLAGPRWSPTPPTDAGISPEESQSEDGFIKISCEDFPQPGMNLKWISDVLDRLVLEANSEKVSKKYAHIPLDTRHIEARNRKHKNNYNSASLRDFPSSWLPPSENVHQ